MVPGIDDGGTEDERVRALADGGTKDERGRALADGGTEDDDAVAEMKEMLESGEDDGDLGDAIDANVEEDEDESSPAMDFGLKVGAPLALVAVGLLFVGPEPLLKFTPGDIVFVDTTSGDGPGNIVYISGLTLALSTLTGLVYPSIASEPVDDFKMDLGLGISFPTIGVLGALVVLMLFWPVLFSLLAGEFLTAGIMLVIAVVAIGIAVAGSIITLAIAAVATLYFVGPALVGSYVGGFLGELVAT